jgi:hypothetical protein
VFVVPADGSVFQDHPSTEGWRVEGLGKIMKLWIVAFIALVPLMAGCADSTDISNIDGMQVQADSEACRAAVARGIGARAVDTVQSADERRAAYERSYRDCMSAKGYPGTP